MGGNRRRRQVNEKLDDTIAFVHTNVFPTTYFFLPSPCVCVCVSIFSPLSRGEVTGIIPDRPLCHSKNSAPVPPPSTSLFNTLPPRAARHSPALSVAALFTSRLSDGTCILLHGAFSGR